MGNPDLTTASGQAKTQLRREEIHARLSYLSWLKVQNESETKEVLQQTSKHRAKDEHLMRQDALRRKQEQLHILHDEETKPLVLSPEMATKLQVEHARSRRAFRKRHKEVMRQFKSLEAAQRNQLVHRQRLARYRSLKAEIKTLQPPQELLIQNERQVRRSKA